jgi:hypothetical protein
MSKLHNKTRKQSGFVDLGLSLLVMAIAAGGIYVTESTGDDKEQIAENLQPATVQTLHTAANYTRDDQR